MELNKEEMYEKRLKEAKNELFDLKEDLESAKERAFSAHEKMLQTNYKTANEYELACEEREELREKVSEAESKVNSIVLQKSQRDFEANQSEMYASGRYGKEMANIAFFILGLCTGLIVLKLF